MCFGRTIEKCEAHGTISSMEYLESDSFIDELFIYLQNYIPNIAVGIIAYTYEISDFIIYMFTSDEAEELFNEPDVLFNPMQ